jgi:arylsulfatase A-like enzyme
VPPPAPKRYAGQFGNSALDSLGKPSFNEGNVKDKPKLLRKRKVRVASVRARHDGRVRSLRAVDDANARVVQTLARTGELENTVVMFTSDNGYLMGEHRWMEKTLGYEESLQVPLVVRGPKVPRNEKAVSTATVVDLASTIVDLANADPDLTLDGQSLVPLMRRPATAQRTGDTVLIQGGPRSRREDKWGWLYRGVRTDRYTFVKYGNKKKELYDRVEDPFQLTNVSGKAAYDAVEADLKRRLNALVDCAGRSCNATFGPDLAPH